MRLAAFRTLIVVCDWKRTLGNSGVLLVQGVVLDFGGARRSLGIGTWFRCDHVSLRACSPERVDLAPCSAAVLSAAAHASVEVNAVGEDDLASLRIGCMQRA